MESTDPAGGQAYDNAAYRWNNREHELPGATFDSILAGEQRQERLAARQAEHKDLFDSLFKAADLMDRASARAARP